MNSISSPGIGGIVRRRAGEKSPKRGCAVVVESARRKALSGALSEVAAAVVRTQYPPDFAEEVTPVSDRINRCPRSSSSPDEA
jgi:hypothetical protein